MVRHTLETRWFFPQPPIELAAWPAESISAERTDWYAVPCHPGTGVKFREGNFEAKLLIEDHGVRELAGTLALVQTWQKWSAGLQDAELPAESVLANTGWVAVIKQRHMWCFEVADGAAQQVSDRVSAGCEFEWTQISVQEQSWWTVGLEAIGEAEALDENLRLVAEHVFAGRDTADQFTADRSMGYPAWLGQFSADA